jgi:hypothetical protein
MRLFVGKHDLTSTRAVLIATERTPLQQQYKEAPDATFARLALPFCQATRSGVSRRKLRAAAQCPSDLLGISVGSSVPLTKHWPTAFHR